MSLRAKLLLLLASVALLPLVLLTVLQYRSMLDLSTDLEAESKQRLVDSLTTALAQNVETNAYGLDHSAETVSLSLEVAIAQVEARLAAAYGAGPIYANSRFARTAAWPPGTHLISIGGSAAIPVSFNFPSTVYAPGVDPRAVRADAIRLSTMSRVYSTLYAEHKTSVFEFMLGLENGLFMIFPGHAEPRGFDGRTRPWYRSARGADGIVWNPPNYSASTGQLSLVISRAVHRPDGSVAGVGAAAIAVLDILQRLQAKVIRTASIDRLLASSENILVSPAGNQLRIVARHAYKTESPNWQADIKFATIRPDDPRTLRAVVADVAAGKEGVRRVKVGGRDFLWAYCSVRALNSALLFSLPYDRITEEASALNATLQKRAIAQVDTSVLLGIVIAAVVAVVAIVVASLASRPIHRLAEAATRIGSGDLTARAEIAGSDEIGALGAAFNSMVPKLEEGLRMRSSLELARAVQLNLLPSHSMNVGPLDIAGFSRYCDETGGDYYDFVDISNGSPRVAVAVGDVSGHGIAAALLMASARALLRSSLGDAPDPALAMEHTNALLSADINDGNFMTMALLVIDASRRNVRWVNAAHDASLIFDIDKDVFVPLDGADLPLGVEGGWHFTERRLDLPPTDVVIAAGTDGVWESLNDRGEAFGRRRLCESIRRHARLPATTLCERVLDDLEAFRNGAPQDDDITLVIAKLASAGPNDAPGV